MEEAEEEEEEEEEEETTQYYCVPRNCLIRALPCLMASALWDSS